MAPASPSFRSRSSIAAYLCIGAALLLLLTLTIWGTYRDLHFLRRTLLEAQISQLRSHAERTVGRIERDLQLRGVDRLEDLEENGWLHRYWQQVVPQTEGQFYAAVLNSDGVVLHHSEPSRRGRRLSRNWYHRILFDVGGDVVETGSVTLTGGVLAYDVSVGIELDNVGVGDYHTGLDAAWFERWTAGKESAFLMRRSLSVGGILLIVLLAMTSLYGILLHSIALRRAVDSASIERASEVGQLAAGLAHEIRNPLHAIQLNLHSFRRAHEQSAALSPEEIGNMLEQSTCEIERIEQLMQELVGFAAPNEPRLELIDLRTEIHDVVEFIHQEMLDRSIEIRTDVPPVPLRAHIDRGRLRQIMLNLLQNSQQAMEQGGQIDVRLVQRRTQAEITVADNGPGISEEDCARVFEPFYSTKSEGSGLGLALVKRYVDELGGDITCESHQANGVTMRIRLQLAHARRQAGN